jgi:hypothetical protein
MFREAQTWWASNRLDLLNLPLRRMLINELLRRSTNEASSAALALFGSVPFPELNLGDVELMQAWFALESGPSRPVRDALAIRVLVPWFAANSEELLAAKLQLWLASERPYLVRAALVVSVGLVHQSVNSHFSTIVRVLERLPNLDFWGEWEVEPAIGWLIANVWRVAPTFVQEWLDIHGAELSRNGFRLAVGRMPTPIRAQLTGEWKAKRKRKCPPRA